VSVAGIFFFIKVVECAADDPETVGVAQAVTYAKLLVCLSPFVLLPEIGTALISRLKMNEIGMWGLCEIGILRKNEACEMVPTR